MKLSEVLKSKNRLIIGILIALNAALLSTFFISAKVAAPAVNEVDKQLAQADQSLKGLIDFFVALSNDKGAPHALDVLKVATIPPNIDLHLLAHAVGDTLYEQEGIEGMRFCTHDFRNACSHSIVIRALLEQGEGVLDKINKVCKEAPGGKGAYTMCFHGFGHGVLAYTDYNPVKAMTLCERTGTEEKNNREYIECIGGVTMEMVSGIHDRATWEEQKEVYLDEDDPLAFCKTHVPEGAREMCYAYITPELFTAAGMSLAAPDPQKYEKAFSFCESNTEDVDSREQCYASFGKEFVVLAQDRDIRKIEETSNEQLANIFKWCSFAKVEDGVKACTQSALSSLYWGGENDPDVSVRFCSIITDRTLQESCFNTLIRAVSYYKDEQGYYDTFCSMVPTSYKDQCLEELLQSS